MKINLFQKMAPVTFGMLLAVNCPGQITRIDQNTSDKTVVLSNKKMELLVDYNSRITVSRMLLNGQTIIRDQQGISSGISTKTAEWSTQKLERSPLVKRSGNTIVFSGIVYGDKTVKIEEAWTFKVEEEQIRLKIDRIVSKPIVADRLGFPNIVFDNLDTWDGAYQDYGGIAWFYLFNKKPETYGVHSASSAFWNSKTGNGLNISVHSPGQQVVTAYSRTSEDKLSCTIGLSQKEMTCRYDSGTYRRRFLRDQTDVWAPVQLRAGKTSEEILFSWFSYREEYGRGELAGINGEQVEAVLGTIARIGVIDKEHFGGNSWHTPYGPICLHEQYIAQMGLAINDDHYLKGYQQCLDYYRDNAFKPGGRVWPRWAYTNEDMMPGEVTDKGFYEAQWGYLLDANPDFVTNVSELYDQTGNKAWVKSQQAACEKALDWILQRDKNNNGLVEMMTDEHSQKKGSDWIDIIWASYENAFVNAKLYHALVLWAAIEKQLGNAVRSKLYINFATKLKQSFNRTVHEGGFWDEEKQCYVHWREKDGSGHGNNLVTPVNFMAIAYGICDDSSRTKAILDGIEVQMEKEQLFFWPLCMYSYAAGEGNDWQFPFPNYENGDIFLSWGAVAVKAYASYKPELALKYVRNVLAQYAKDGLSFQRYGRAKQDGLGDDILSGNCLAVVGLYQAIYGVNPLYNRFYLNPHITGSISGTALRYHFRGQQLKISLEMNKYSVGNDQFRIVDKSDFGFFSTGNELRYFRGDAETPLLELTVAGKNKVNLEMEKILPGEFSWKQTAEGKEGGSLLYRIHSLKPQQYYSILENGKPIRRVLSSKEGSILFRVENVSEIAEIRVAKK